MKATLLLEDGSLFEGISIGSQGERAGPVILNTAIVGYQEMMTDPANAGKILILTYPLIGNYGVAKKFNESDKCRIAGLIIKEASRIHSNWQAEGSFDDFVKKEDVVTMSDADTRTIAVTIRDKDEMLGIISTKTSSKEDLAKKLKSYEGIDFIKDISVKKPVEIKGSGFGHNIAILDIGITNSVIKQLKNLGCNITILPYDTDADRILEMKPDGLLISNGPEEDIAIPKVAKTIRELIGRVPMMGIAAGHEAIALALGFKLKRLPIGHRGVNYPAKATGSFKGEITVQNHGFAVDDKSAAKKKDVTVTLRNVNDNTIEEMESRALKFISTQYNPVSPGFDEVNGAFRRFLKMAKARKSAKLSHSARATGEVQHAKA